MWKSGQGGVELRPPASHREFRTLPILNNFNICSRGIVNWPILENMRNWSDLT